MKTKIEEALTLEFSGPDGVDTRTFRVIAEPDFFDFLFTDIPAGGSVKKIVRAGKNIFTQE